MTEAPEHTDGYGELDLGQILRMLYRRKWLILGVTLLAGLAAGLYSLTKPNVYETSAALIVRDPQDAMDQDPEKQNPIQTTPNISVETLQTLAESTETVWTLFDRLWEKQALESWKGATSNKLSRFRSFQGALNTELKRQQNRRASNSVELLPIIVLTARATDPAEAEIIANEWANIVEEKSRELYTLGVEASDTFIGDMYKQSNDTLLTLENQLATTVLEAGLDLKKDHLKTLTDKITVLEGAILEIKVQLAVNETAIAQGKRRIEELQVGDEWIGTVAEELLLRGEPYPFDPQNLVERAGRILDLVQQKVTQREATRQYRKEQNLLVKQTDFAHYQADIERIMLEKAKAEDEIPALETALASLQAQLENIPEKIVLDKAITDDALWNNYLDKTGGSEKTGVPLKSETMNPLYNTTRQMAVDLTSKIETQRGSLAQLEASASRVDGALTELEIEIDQIQQEIDRQTQVQEAIENSLKLLRDDFLAEKNRIEELLAENMRKQEEMDTRQEARDQIEDQVKVMEADISDYKLEIDKLTREVEKTKNVRTALASKAEAVALLQVTAENASRTGTAILYNARVNPNKIGPDRSRLVLGAMVVAMVACGLMLCTAKLLQESEQTG